MTPLASNRPSRLGCVPSWSWHRNGRELNGLGVCVLGATRRKPKSSGAKRANPVPPSGLRRDPAGDEPIEHHPHGGELLLHTCRAYVVTAHQVRKFHVGSCIEAWACVATKRKCPARCKVKCHRGAVPPQWGQRRASTASLPRSRSFTAVKSRLLIDRSDRGG